MVKKIKHYKDFKISNCDKKSILLVGNFDGLHLGHQKLFKLAKKYKKKYKLKVGVLTFEPMPKMYFNNSIKNFRISSLDQKNIIDCLTEVKKQSPKIPRAYLTFQQEKGMKIKKTIYSKSPWIDHIPLTIVYDLPKIIKELGGSAWHPYFKDINKKAVEDAHDNNLPVNVWTVNDEDDMLKMVEYGVDGIMTDYPLRLKEVCEKENINWF